LALALGKPVVATKIGLFAELLDSRHGALVPPEDVKSLSNALGPLIADAVQRARAAEAVKKLAGSIPGWKEIAEMTTDVYRRARI
jgi:glycosyltransferase involved in cell wall biosynthesis